MDRGYCPLCQREDVRVTEGKYAPHSTKTGTICAGIGWPVVDIPHGILGSKVGKRHTDPTTDRANRSGAEWEDPRGDGDPNKLKAAPEHIKPGDYSGHPVGNRQRAVAIAQSAGVSMSQAELSAMAMAVATNIMENIGSKIESAREDCNNAIASIHTIAGQDPSSGYGLEASALILQAVQDLGTAWGNAAAAIQALENWAAAIRNA